LHEKSNAYPFVSERGKAAPFLSLLGTSIIKAKAWCDLIPK
jgi:hypothetical protein